MRPFSLSWLFFPSGVKRRDRHRPSTMTCTCALHLLMQMNPVFSLHRVMRRAPVSILHVLCSASITGSICSGEVDRTRAKPRTCAAATTPRGVRFTRPEVAASNSPKEGACLLRCFARNVQQHVKCVGRNTLHVQCPPQILAHCTR